MSDDASSATATPGEEIEAPQGPGVRKSSRPKEPASTTPPVTWTEESLNAPSRQTLGMLAILATTTLIMWAAGRAACNYHEPGESVSPKEASLEARTRTEKDAAFELQHSWVAADFDTAAELVVGSLAQTLEEEKRDCQGSACEARRRASEEMFSVAEVLQRNRDAAFVRVRTVGAPSGEVTYVYELVREGAAWKGARRLGPNEPVPRLTDTPPQELEPAAEAPAPEAPDEAGP